MFCAQIVASLACGCRYDCQELNENPPEHPIYERIIRNILQDKPRVTRYQVSGGVTRLAWSLCSSVHACTSAHACMVLCRFAD